MDTKRILADLRVELDRIDRATAEIEDLNSDWAQGSRPSAKGRPEKAQPHERRCA